jgi:hypothetical protein
LIANFRGVKVIYEQYTGVVDLCEGSKVGSREHPLQVEAGRHGEVDPSALVDNCRTEAGADAQAGRIDA